MAVYQAYLEIDPKGICMAHLLDLPGCMVRRGSRAEALEALPGAIREYFDWLRRHGEEVQPPEEVTVEVAETSRGYGPFSPGDAAALFAPDCEPVGRAEMQAVYFHRAGYAREDLRELVKYLPPSVLDWQPDEGAISIRRILRHVGNAEEWYVSRLVPPETLPVEWEGDEDLPIKQFLEMERRTALHRLRQLTDEALGALTYPSQWTEHPEEAWTARKALRRMIEHEREHTGHIREVLAGWRLDLLRRMASERAAFLEQLLGFDEQVLSMEPVFGDYTAKDLLAHAAAWDEWHTRATALILDGRVNEIPAVDLEARNAALLAEHKGMTLDEALEYFTRARWSFLENLSRASDEELHRRPAPGVWSIRKRAERRAGHDREHAAHLRRWRERLRAEGNRLVTGPKSILLAALRAGRGALLAAMALVPEDERETRPVTGDWTLADVAGHVADWEQFGVQVLRRVLSGEDLSNDPVVAEFSGDIQSIPRSPMRDSRRPPTDDRRGPENSRRNRPKTFLRQA